MQNEITVKPLVSVLSEQLGKQVVMSGDDYVFLKGLTLVSQDAINIAQATQSKLYKSALKKRIDNAIQNLLDTTAQKYQYDNMMSARSYAGYDNQFQAEAQTLAVWASNCWVKIGEIEADVEAGNRAMPTADEVLAEMPEFEGL